MAESIEHRLSKAHIAESFDGCLECPLPLGYRADFCGIVDGQRIYAEADCRRVREEMVCWISVYDLETDSLLDTWPCPYTPTAASYPRELIIGNRECLSCRGAPIRNRALQRITF